VTWNFRSLGGGCFRWGPAAQSGKRAAEGDAGCARRRGPARPL